ncbi:MAG: c-type cytochrome [Chthoniobacterales bacterium]
MNNSNNQHSSDELQPERDLVELQYSCPTTDHATEESHAIASTTAEKFFRPVPFWLAALSMGLLFWAGMYLAYNSGGFNANVFNADVVSWSGGGAAAAAAPIDLKVIGKKVFTQTCVVCHQETGLGISGQFPSLVDTEWVLSQDWHGDNHLVKQILYGLQGPITVKGLPFNNAMTAWNQLSDQQIAGVLTYIRSSWGNTAPPITPEFVAKVRTSTKPLTEAWTLPELKAIPREMCTDAPAAAAPAPAK